MLTTRHDSHQSGCLLLGPLPWDNATSHGSSRISRRASEGLLQLASYALRLVSTSRRAFSAAALKSWMPTLEENKGFYASALSPLGNTWTFFWQGFRSYMELIVLNVQCC